LFLGVVAFCACHQSPASAPSERPQAGRDAGPADAGVPVQDAGPRPIPGAHLSVARDAGGTAAPNAQDGDAGDVDDAGPVPEHSPLSGPAGPEAPVPDSASLSFIADVPLDDFRARVLGTDGRLIPNRSETWAADGGTLVNFTPSPLWPSRGCCRLVVDGETGKLPAAGATAYLPFEVDFTVAPSPERAQAEQIRQQQHRRHHRRRN